MKKQTVEQLILNSIGELGAVEKTASDSFNENDALKVSKGLEKISSFQYNPDTYDAVQGIMKIASEIISSAVKAVNDKNNEVKQFEKAAEIRSIVDEMIDRGLIDDYDAKEKIEKLASKTKSELEIVKEAMKMVKSNSSGNIFSEDIEKTASSTGSDKPGMFDSVIFGQ